MKTLKVKKQKSKSKLLADRCYLLWRECVYAQAKGKSELSGEITRNAHHVYGKSSKALRYDVRNGINLTIREHIYGVHNNDPSVAGYYQEEIRNKIKEREGKDIFETFMLEKNIKSKTNLAMTELYLKAKLKELQEAI